MTRTNLQLLLICMLSVRLFCAAQSTPPVADPAPPPASSGATENKDPSHPLRVQASSSVAAGNLIKKVPPHYPVEAKAAGIMGTVLFNVVIDTQGNVTHIQLVEGHPLLVSAALDAVKQWKYKPYLLNGQPVEVETEIKVIFSLEGMPATESSPKVNTAEALGGKLPKDGQIVPGTLTKKIEPEYPAKAKAEGLSGSVTLRVTIDKKGNVIGAQPMGGDPLFFDSAVKALRQWKYTPSTVKGKPINIVTQLTLNYKTPPVSSSQNQKANLH
jgi:TonB family protein